ncbi:MAG: flagellar hook-associated protein FlgL [Gammaproteobacteria bacterium]|nr:flagellar hook-associated protein FlgL [Gammaproteobacteria bacterium]
MRVSTASAYINGISAIQRLQEALDFAQRQISTGRRILAPSDDPIASARSLELRESLSRLNQFDRNAGIATNRLSQEEAGLSSVGNVLQRVRELTLQANNATQSDETRALIAIEMREQLDHLVQLANQKDGTGRYLFSGNLGDVQPVTRMGSTFAYNGDQGQRFIQVGEGRQVADGDPGSAIFFQIRNGNGVFSTAAAAANTGTGLLGTGSVVDPTQYDQDQYTLRFIGPGNYEVVDSLGGIVTTGSYQSGDTVAFRGIEFSLSGQPATGDEFVVSPSQYQSVFATIDNIATALERSITDDASRAAMTNGANAGLIDIDQALGKVLDIRTQVGSRLAVTESQVDSNGAYALIAQETLAEIEDLDYAEAISRLSLQVSTLEAAQQSFIRTQSLSLFNYF